MLKDISIGKELSPVVKHITQEEINRYAQASGDFNPIHVDEDFAARTPLKGTIAHGMLILAYISEMMMVDFGEDWFSAGKLAVRFKEPARPGDIIVVSGRVSDIDNEGDISHVRCAVECSIKGGDVVITGSAEVKVKTKG